MPIHDWTPIDAGTFHDFHQDWTIEIRRVLNSGILPSGYFAMTDQRILSHEPDIISLKTPIKPSPGATGSALAVADAPPRVRHIERWESEAAAYARRANRIAIRHHRGVLVAIIEVVSPGNKHSTNALETFVSKIVNFLNHGIHALVIDLLAPSPRDPNGIHEEIWRELAGESLEHRPPDKPLTVVSYDAGDALTAYFEPLAVGDLLPDIPLFLEPGVYVPVPLERAYLKTWNELPREIRESVSP